jgi:hypothetical protein
MSGMEEPMKAFTWAIVLGTALSAGCATTTTDETDTDTDAAETDTEETDTEDTDAAM